jgi:hypothetical protein
MNIISHQNALSSVIRATGTASTVLELIDSAGTLTNSSAWFSDPTRGGPADGMIITPTDGDVVLGFGFTPTAALGMTLKQGVTYTIPFIELPTVKIIRVGSNSISCEVFLGKSSPGDSFAAEMRTTGIIGASLVASASTAGASSFLDESVDNTEQTLKASTGKLYRLDVENTNAVESFFSLFDSSSSILVGTTTPTKRWRIPPSSTLMIDFGSLGASFSNAIKYAATTTRGGNGNPTTALILNAEYI